jgi:hypothetical protein
MDTNTVPPGRPSGHSYALGYLEARFLPMRSETLLAARPAQAWTQLKHLSVALEPCLGQCPDRAPRSKMIQAEAQHCDHAAVEQIFADLASGPLPGERRVGCLRRYQPQPAARGRVPGQPQLRQSPRCHTAPRPHRRRLLVQLSTSRIAYPAAVPAQRLHHAGCGDLKGGGIPHEEVE